MAYMKRKNLIDYNRSKHYKKSPPFAVNSGNVLGGRIHNLGDHKIILTRSPDNDEKGRPLYMATLYQKEGIFSNKIRKAGHYKITKV